MRHRLHDTGPAPLPCKWVVLFPMGAFTHDGAGAVAVDGVGAIDSMPHSLGSVPISPTAKMPSTAPAPLPCRVNGPLHDYLV